MEVRKFILGLILHLLVCVLSAKSRTDWNAQAQQTIKQMLNRKLNTNKAKNVILFLGDGMGVSTVTAGRILRGQRQNKTGEETVLAFETFPHLALSKTYNVDKQVPDSAATATAFLCGVKTNYLILGLDETAVFNNCSSSKGAEVSCIYDWFHDDGRLHVQTVNEGFGKLPVVENFVSNPFDTGTTLWIVSDTAMPRRSVGVITNTRITHATPAAGYAKSASRDWEGTDTMTAVEGGCKDIAYQLVYNNSYIQVIFGGGRRYFLKQNQIDPEDQLANNANQRSDGLDLTEVWKQDKQAKNKKYAYVYKTDDFNAIDPATTDYALGLFSAGHMDYEVDRDKGPHGEPSLAAMTSKAIKILQKNKKGFFLHVESGRIDHAHHNSNAYRSLTELLQFEEAIKEAMKLTNEEDTLIVVSADHDHVFNIAGYPKRGNDIFGVADPILPIDMPTDDLAYTTLVYGNGPGYKHGNRTNVKEVDTTSIDYIQASAVPMEQETHAGSDVAIYARGPMSHLFDGTQEQNYIAHVMAYASCVGMNKGHCDNPTDTSSCKEPMLLTLFVTILAQFFFLF